LAIYAGFVVWTVLIVSASIEAFFVLANLAELAAVVG